MLTGSAANSFADDIMKWQKRLQTIEAVLSVWLEVQDKWIELEDVSIIRALQLRLTDWLTHGTHAKVKQCEKWQHTLEVTKVNKLGTIPISEISCTKFSLESRECLFPKFYLTAWKISKHSWSVPLDTSLLWQISIWLKSFFPGKRITSAHETWGFHASAKISVMLLRFSITCGI